jgi:hypothetical protein
VFLGAAARPAAGTTGVEEGDVPSMWSVPSAAFTLADFDGDLQPDLASVQARPYKGDGTHYTVEVRLSATVGRSIDVIGPAGGLQIRAADVNNGNHFIDLVLTAAWSRQPVAILINDGNGNFSKVPPSAFPDAFTDSSRPSIFGTIPAIHNIEATLLQRASIHSQVETTAAVQLQTDSVSPWNSVSIFVAPLIPRPGRAPPRQPAPDVQIIDS